MTCENVVGVKNILMTFTDCQSGRVIGPYSHELATEELPMWRPCTYVSEAMTQGYVKKTANNASAEISVIRNLAVPLAWYQGCASIDIQVEYENGLVYTGTKGTTIGEEKSDSHEVSMEITFRQLDELLPDGELQEAA